MNKNNQNNKEDPYAQQEPNKDWRDEFRRDNKEEKKDKSYKILEDKFILVTENELRHLPVRVLINENTGEIKIFTSKKVNEVGYKNLKLD